MKRISRAVYEELLSRKAPAHVHFIFMHKDTKIVVGEFKIASARRRSTYGKVRYAFWFLEDTQGNAEYWMERLPSDGSSYQRSVSYELCMFTVERNNLESINLTRF